MMNRVKTNTSFSFNPWLHHFHHFSQYSNSEH